MDKKSKPKKKVEAEEEWEDEKMDGQLDKKIPTETSQQIISDPISQSPPIALAGIDLPEEDEIL